MLAGFVYKGDTVVVPRGWFVLSSRRCARVGESGDAMGCIRCRQKWPDVPLLLRTLVQSTYHARGSRRKGGYQ